MTEQVTSTGSQADSQRIYFGGASNSMAGLSDMIIRNHCKEAPDVETEMGGEEGKLGENERGKGPNRGICATVCPLTVSVLWLFQD